MPGIFVAQLPQRCDLQESFDGRWAEPLYNILTREVRGLVPPYSRQRSIERRHFLHLQTPTMEHYTYNNGLMQAAGGGRCKSSRSKMSPTIHALRTAKIE